MKTFYRVCNPETQQGLWYNFDGSFAGLIHTWFDFCTNSELEMEFDEALVGWLSAVENLDDLWAWLTPADVEQLEARGWYIHEYEAADWKTYGKFQHPVIHQETARPVRRIPIASLGLVAAV